MDQSFSPRSLRRVWDRQTRRGKHLLGLYPDVRKAYETARSARERARAIRKGVIAYVGPDPEEPDRTAKEARAEADALLVQALGNTSAKLIDQVETGAFSWGLKQSYVHNGRQLYETSSSPEVFFADRHLQSAVSMLFPVRPPSRQAVVGGLARSLDNALPKVVLRADVKSFYDSVDHQILLDHVRESPLSPTSTALIAALLSEAAAISGKRVGLPAGVGLSAKLAELYITMTDLQIREQPQVLFYARYVDDIVLVCGELTPGTPAPSSYVSLVAGALDEIKLTLNTSKQFADRLDAAGNLPTFEFLGYEFGVGSNRLRVRLTRSRIDTLKRRIDRAFEAWERHPPNNHGRRRLLVDRLRLTAGNTRLAHNKRNAMVGVYFSNPHLSDLSDLKTLDGHLRRRASSAKLPVDLAAIVSSISFVDGFESKRMYSFTPTQLRKIRGAWNA